jgi:hypothetical protein
MHIEKKKQFCEISNSYSDEYEEGCPLERCLLPASSALIAVSTSETSVNSNQIT